MRVPVLMLCLSLAGCDPSPRFQVGDCIEVRTLPDLPRERWDKASPYQILELGQAAYRVKFVGGLIDDISIPFTASWAYMRVPCKEST